MPELGSDASYLRDDQYRDASKLNARIYIHRNFSTNPYGWSRFVFDHLLALPPEARVLEVGAGPGSLWLDSIDRIPPGWQITLTDFSPGMVAQAQAALAAHPAFVTFRVADAQELPFADACFDGVIANHMLYHVPEPGRAIGEMRRVLKPCGRFFAATNGAEHMAAQWELVRRHNPNYLDWHTPLMRAFSLENGADHLRAFFANVLLDPYEDGLRVTEVEPLIDYMASMNVILPDERARFAQVVEQAMQEQGGAIDIRKASGIFVAS